MDYVAIGDLINMVQDELIESQKSRIAAGKAPLFRTDELELELSTEVASGGNGKFTLMVPIMNLEMSGDNNKKNIQKVKLKFKVVDDDEKGPTFQPKHTGRIDGRLPKLDE